MKFMRYIMSSLLVLLCSGCAAIVAHNTRVPFPQQRTLAIEVRELRGGDEKLLAYMERTGNSCVIYLRQYPVCLQHEMRHCFEGNFHEGHTSDEDCYK